MFSPSAAMSLRIPLHSLLLAGVGRLCSSLVSRAATPLARRLERVQHIV